MKCNTTIARKKSTFLPASGNTDIGLGTLGFFFFFFCQLHVVQSFYRVSVSLQLSNFSCSTTRRLSLYEVNTQLGFSNGKFSIFY